MRKLHRLWHVLKLIARCGRTGKQDIVLKTRKPELDQQFPANRFPIHPTLQFSGSPRSRRLIRTCMGLL